MTDETTAALLADLRAAIDELEAGGGDPERVADLAGRVERRLDAEVELHDDKDNLAEELRERAVRFEADHPRLAGTVRRVADAIGGLGI